MKVEQRSPPPSVATGERSVECLTEIAALRIPGAVFVPSR